MGTKVMKSKSRSKSLASYVRNQNDQSVFMLKFVMFITAALQQWHMRELQSCGPVLSPNHGLHQHLLPQQG